MNKSPLLKLVYQRENIRRRCLFFVFTTMWIVKQTVMQVVLVILFNTVIVYAQYVGDSCYHNAKKAQGTCKSIQNCPGAIEGIAQGNFPQQCSFQGAVPIVCCVTADSVANTPAPTSTPKPTPTTTRKPSGPLKIGEKSLQKCQQYREYSYVVEKSPLLSAGKGTIKTDKCTFTARKLIVGGEPTKPDEFPHMAVIGYNNGDEKAWDCGGTLISERFVMTAAHCLYSRNYGSPTVVRLGDLNLLDPRDDTHVEQINIKRLIEHPQYSFPSQYNDIALLELEKPPVLSTHIRPACLFTEKNLNSERAMATGWGLTEDLGDRSNILLKVTLDFFNGPTCNKTYRSSTRLSMGIDDDTQICAGSNYEEKDTCQGDSGGPLQFYSNTFCMYDIVGITSFGSGCGFIGIPAVYTRVSSYLGWIEKEVWP